MKLKRIAAAVMAAALMTACAVPASALTGSASTDTYYVNQEESYGSIKLTSQKAKATTYCELASAGKIANCYYFYNTTSGTVKTLKKVTEDFTTGSKTLTKSLTTSDKSNFSSNYGAFSTHKVQVTSYITWSSEASEDRPLVGKVKSAYSDYNEDF